MRLLLDKVFKKINMLFIHALDFIQDNPMISLAIVSIIILIVTILENLFYQEYRLGIIIVFSILLFIGFVGGVLQYKNESMRKQNQLDNLQNYTEELESLYNDMREFKHDYINILSTLSCYINDKEYIQLETYFNEKILPISQKIISDNRKIDLLKNIGIPEIKSIVAMKSMLAQENGIDFYVEAIDKIEYIHMDIIALSRAIGIILDNAIEAAMLCDNPHIHIAFVNHQNTVTIIVANSCADDVPSIHQIFQHGFSTKGNGHGLGLSYLKKILLKYPSTVLDTNIQDNIFKITITI